MTHTIEVTGIPEELLRRLDERVRDVGTDREQYIRDLLARDLERPSSLRELFAPVREDFVASGMTGDELEALIEECREEAYQERLARQPENPNS